MTLATAGNAGNWTLLTYSYNLYERQDAKLSFTFSDLSHKQIAMI